MLAFHPLNEVRSRLLRKALRQRAVSNAVVLSKSCAQLLVM